MTTAPGPGAVTNGGAVGAAPATVFFLSDYGLRDEFVGVVHAVLHRLAPGATVVDLTHDVPPFDVRSGAEALLRSVPHLGPGVVLGVVDPGVGGGRKGLALESAGPGAADPPGGGASLAPAPPLYFVGPDNGLLLPAAEAAGGIRRAVELGVDEKAAPTFDGRDVFAPAVAALCRRASITELGPPVPVDELVRVPRPVCEAGRTTEGRRTIRAEVTWVDRFGNVQLAAVGDAIPMSVPAVTATVEPVAVGPGATPKGTVPAGWAPPELVSRVRTFADLSPGEVGLLVDANGRLALVVREGSAAARLGVGSGDLVSLTW